MATGISKLFDAIGIKPSTPNRSCRALDKQFSHGDFPGLTNGPKTADPPVYLPYK